MDVQMRKLILPLLLMLACGAADFEDSPADVAIFRKAVSEQRPLMLKQWKAKLVNLQQTLRRCNAGSIDRKLTEDASVPNQGGVAKFRSKEIKSEWIVA